MAGSLGPVILDGAIRYISPSQLTAFDATVYAGCERRWWFRYVAKKPEKGTKAADLGTKVHAQIEHYERTAEDVLGEIARAGLRFIPKPGPDLRIEVGFGELQGDRVVSPVQSGGIAVIGRIDLIHTRSEWIDDEGKAQPLDGLETVDWKSTKRIDPIVEDGIVKAQGYAKTGEDLARTWQMVAYGMVGLTLKPDAREVRSSHGYFQTVGQRSASKRSATLTSVDVKDRWAKSEALVERMRAAAREGNVERLPANYNACGSYGGCPHRTYCPRDPKKILAEALGTKGAAMNLLERLKQSSPTPTPIMVPPAVAAEIKALVAEEQTLKGITPPDMPSPTPSTLACKVCGKPSSRLIQSTTGTYHLCGTCEVSLVQPPSLAVQTPIAPAPVAIPTTCPMIGKQIELSTSEAVSKKHVCACGMTLKVKPQEMGGKYFALVPKHEEKRIKITAVAEDGTRTPVVPAPEPAPVAIPTPVSVESTPVSTAPIAPGLTTHPHAWIDSLENAFMSNFSLYLDCIPDGVITKRLEAYAERLATALAEQYKAADIRCAPSESPLAFGKWKGALGALVKAEPPPPGAYVVSSSSELGMVAFEALASTARVVRGVR